MPEQPILMLYARLGLLIWLGQWLVTGWFVQIAVARLFPDFAHWLQSDWVPWLVLATAIGKLLQG